MSLRREIVIGIDGDDSGLIQQLADAEARAKRFLAGLNVELKRTQASVAEQLARGELTAQDAALRNVQAEVRRNEALLAEITRARSGGQLTGQAGDVYYHELASALKTIDPAAQRAAAALRDVAAAEQEAQRAAAAEGAAVAQAARLSAEQVAQLKANLATSKAARESSGFGTLVQAEARVARDAAFVAGTTTARAYVTALTEELDRDFARASAGLKVAVARGLLTPEEARKQGAAAARAYDAGLVATLGRLPGAGGAQHNEAFALLAGKLKNVEPGVANVSKLGQLLEQGLAGGAAAATASLGPLGAAITSVGGVSALAIAALVGVGVAGAKMAADVEAAAGRVETALNLTGDQAQAMRADIVAFSTEFGRGQTEIAALMQTVADNGPGGAEGLRAMTRAALELAAVTGQDPNGLAAGLDQVIDAFGLSGASARQVAADIFAVTRGKVPLDDLFQVLARVAAQARGAGIDIHVLEGAVAALLDAGVAPRQLAAELEKLATSGENGRQLLKELAGGGRDSAKSLAEYQAAVQTAEQRTAALSARLHQELNAELTELGTHILPPAVAGMRTLIGAIERYRAAGGLSGIGGSGDSLGGSAPLPTRIAALFAGGGAPTSRKVELGAIQSPALDVANPNGTAADLAAERRIEAIRRATKKIGEVSVVVVQKYKAELETLAHGTSGIGATARTTAATLADELAAGLEEAGKTLEAKAKAASEAVASFTRSIARAVAQETETQVDDLREELRALDDEAKAKKAQHTAAYTTRREDLLRQIELTERAEATAKRVADAAARSNADANAAARDLLHTVEEIGAKTPDGGFELVDESNIEAAAELEARIKAVLALAASGAVTIDDQQLAALKAAAEQLAKALDGLTPTNRAGSPATPNVKQAHDWAAEIASGARALGEALQAAGLLDARMASLVNSAITFAESLSKVIKSKGADVGADIAAVASLVNLAKGLFGKSEADKAHQRAVEANTKAIEALARQAGDLAALSVSGGAFGGVRNAVASIVGQTAGRSGGAKVKGVDDVLAGLGLSSEDLDAIAKTLNITLDGTVDSFRKLDAAIKAADFKAFADSWAGALAEFDAVTRIDGVNDPLARLKAFATTALERSGSSLIGSFLKGADLDSAEGRAAVRASARQWFQAVLDGTIDPSTFGKLNFGEILQFLETFIGDVDAIGASADATATAATAAATALDRLNDTLSGIVDAGRLLGTGGAEQLRQTVGALAEAFPQIRDGLQHLLDDVDLSTAAGVATFTQRLRDLFLEVTHNGVIVTDTDRKIASALLTILGDGEQIFDAFQQGATTTSAVVSAAIADMVQQVQSALAGLTRDASRLGLSPELTAETTGAAFNDSGLTLSNGQRVVDLVGQFDFADPAQRARALTLVRAQYRGSTGTDKEFWGSYIDFLQSIPDTVGAPGAGAPGGAGSGGAGSAGAAGGSREVGSAVQTVTEQTGVRLGDLFTSLFLLEQDELPRQTAELEAIHGLLASLASLGPSGPLEAPALPATGRFGAGVGGPGVVVNVEIDIGHLDLGGATTPADRAAAGAAFAEGVSPVVVAAVNRGLGQQQGLDNLLQGKTAVRVR